MNPLTTNRSSSKHQASKSKPSLENLAFLNKSVQNTPNHSKTQAKKFLKGKLMKLLNEAIIKEQEKFLQEKNKLFIKTENKKKTISIRKNLYGSVNLRTDTFPNLIGKEVKLTPRNLDTFQTPKEFFLKNFSKDEINLIRSDPQYFRINDKENFKDVPFLKTKTLAEVLQEEEKTNKKYIIDFDKILQSNHRTRIENSVKKEIQHHVKIVLKPKVNYNIVLKQKTKPLKNDDEFQAKIFKKVLLNVNKLEESELKENKYFFEQKIKDDHGNNKNYKTPNRFIYGSAKKRININCDISKSFKIEQTDY